MLDRIVSTTAREILFARLMRLILIMVPMITLWMNGANVVSQDKFDLASLSRGSNDDPLQLTATYELKEANKGLLKVTAQLSAGWHIYSSTQPAGGPLKTVIKSTNADVKLIGTPVPDHEPESKPSVEFEGILEETHHDKVTWSVPIEFAKTGGNEKIQLELQIRGQVCEASCIPINKKVLAKYVESGPTLAKESTSPTPSFPIGDNSSKPDAKKTFRDPKGHVDWSVHVAKSKAKPGESVELLIEAVPDLEYHLYRMEPGAEETNFRTTLVVTNASKNRLGNVVSSTEAIAKDIGGTIYEVHEGSITWRVPIVMPQGVPAEQQTIEGMIGYQACTDELCDQPLAFRFRGTIEVSQLEGGKVIPFQIEAVDFKEVVRSPVRRTWMGNDSSAMIVSDQSKESSKVDQVKGEVAASAEKPDLLTAQQLAKAFFLAIMGGFILNFMPCVLPVIGLKVLAFVEESEGSPRHVAWLNSWYILGIMTVVMILGLITVVANEFSVSFMWGSQFGNQGFRIGILILVFSMALSFLGVWELPIPGFATGKASNELLAKEGASGAFFKGVITTILATPCTGPFLGTALSFTLGQPSWMVLLIFFGIGLGISLPFIVIAMFPQAIQWLPKPGAWMDTLKQALAFPLLLTVVFFLTTFSNDYRIAAITMLIGVWFACWWIGKIPVWAERKEKAKGWGGAILSATLVGLFSFYYLGPIEKRIDWKPYNEVELSKFTNKGRVVLIDFTAEWCANCKTNLRTAIETDRVAAMIKDKSVIPMIADMTDFPDHIEQKLIELKCAGIPVLAIYPVGKPNDPIVFQGLLTESIVLNAIKEAANPALPNEVSAASSSTKIR